MRLEGQGSLGIQKLAFIQRLEKAKSPKIPGDLGARDSAGVAKDLTHLVKPRGNMPLPAPSDGPLRPGRQNTAPASPLADGGYGK